MNAGRTVCVGRDTRRRAGLSFTPASGAFEASNAGMQAGHSDLARVIVSRIVDAAERLTVRKIPSPDCGHACMAIRTEAAEALRAKAFKVKKRQMEDAGAGTLAAFCVNRRIVTEEGFGHYDMDTTRLGLTELLAEQLEP